jgi:chemotaxis protein MotB
MILRRFIGLGNAPCTVHRGPWTVNMILRRFLWLGCVALLGTAGCVKPKLYRSEVAARLSSEAREGVLKQEINTRREEQAAMVNKLGELNRLLGEQDLKIRTLQEELASRTQQNNLSLGKVLSEKATLEKEMAAQKKLLEERTSLLQGMDSVRQHRLRLIAELHDGLREAYGDRTEAGIVLAVTAESVELTLPDQGLFQRNGVGISAAGKTLLAPLARVLSANPAIDVDVIANTDNALPKDLKQLDDTWEWSLLRATNLVRLLVREFNVNPNQLSPVGRGEFYPLQSNETSEGRQKNRRTLLVLRPRLPLWPETEATGNR